MPMKTASTPRRIYVRHGSPLVCFAGTYFGPPRGLNSALNVDRGAKVEVIGRDHGKAKATVTQGDVVETWIERNPFG